MPKSIIIDPETVFRRDTIHFSDIPVNAYGKMPQEEIETYTSEDLLSLWRDMCAIRKFESILNEIKLKGTCEGVTYNHAGPAHLSIGQEAAAVGMAVSYTHLTKPVFLSEYGIGSLMNAIHEAGMYEQAGARPDLEDFQLMRRMADGLIADWKRFGMEGVYPFPEDMLCDSQRRMARHRLLLSLIHI